MVLRARMPRRLSAILTMNRDPSDLDHDHRITDMTPKEVHAKLDEVHLIVAGLFGNVNSVSADTAFAIGECVGIIAKAKALVGRDIVDQTRAWKNEGRGSKVETGHPD